METYLQKLKEDMDLRGFSDQTKKDYQHNVRRFLEFMKRPPGDMGEKEIREYLLYLSKAMRPTSVNPHNSALRFFFGVTLGKQMNLRVIPKFRTGSKLPLILDRDEIWRLLDVCELKDKAIFMTFYGSGIRLSELANLKIGDIDSKNMQIFVRQGKPKRDRYALLSLSNLEILREYWKQYRPKVWLFESKDGKRYSYRAIQLMMDKNLKKAGIDKPATIHTLRHSFATHLMEDGVDALHIKELMGHVTLRSTAVYVHMTNLNRLGVTSPLDKMGGLSDV